MASTAVRTARAAAATVVAAKLMRSAASADQDKRLRTLRKDNKVSAVMHSGYPVRYWDHDLGPDRPHLLDVGGPRDLTPQPGDALGEADFDVSSDGTFVVTSWHDPAPGASIRGTLVRIDLATAQRATVADDPDADLEHPTISPDGTAVAFIRETHSTPDKAPRITLCHMRSGEPFVELTAEWDRWPTSVTWSVDGSVLIVTADEGGRGPVFAVAPSSGAVTRLTDDDYTYSDVRTAPEDVMFAMRSSYAQPPHPVRIDPDGTVTELSCAERPELPGTLTEVTAAADDGQPVRSWLALPHGDTQAPLVLWMHGGPLASWNAWHWRWNPWLLVARGYAVLMPDPALSTGYGQDFIQRGWGAWGFAPYTDLMAATDAACAHPRVDGTRTAAMGGSFGGYMANWIAGTHRPVRRDRHPRQLVGTRPIRADDRRRVLVGARDDAGDGRTELAAPLRRPDPHPDACHPRGQGLSRADRRGLRLWFELLTESGLPAAVDGTSPHRFLYFPSENHWVLSPQHAKIWYQVVTAFLARHVLGENVELPETLG